MPANNHLQWFEVSKFGGLWTAGAQTLMPADKAQIMSGCHPQLGGGLRAFLKPSSTYDGDDIGTSEVDDTCVGFGVTAKAESAGTDTIPTFFLVTTDAQRALRVPGTSGANATTPDHADFDITGDLDIRVKVALDDWTPSALNVLFSNLSASLFTGYELRINLSGNVVLVWGDGAAIQSATSTAATGITNGEPVWLRATLDVNNGAGGKTVTFYTSTDGSSWSALGAAVTTAGTTSIAAGVQTPTIGARPDDSLPSTGYFHIAEVRNGIAGTVRAHLDFQGQIPGETSLTDDQGHVWTLNSTAEISTDPDTVITDWQVYTRPNGPLNPWLVTAGAFAGETSDLVTPPATQASFVRPFGLGYDTVSLSIRESAGTAGGLWQINDDTSVLTRLTGIADDEYGAVGLVEHQSRLVFGFFDSVRYTAPGAASVLTGAGAGFVRLGPESGIGGTGDFHEGPMVAWMLPIPPGDFIVALRNGNIYNIQGDLDDPTVRELGRWTTMAPQRPVASPNGIFFIIPNQGIVALGLDGSVTGITPDISPAVWNLMPPKVGLGQLAATEKFLFAPNGHATDDHRNGPLVFDFDTKAWFTATHPDDYYVPNPRFMATDNDPRDSGVWVVSGRSPNSQGTAEPYLFHYRTGGGDDLSLETEERASTWEWQSAPLRDPGGRYVDIREVQIPAYAFNDETSTLAVTIDGTTTTRTLPAGRSTQVFLVKKRGITLDVKVKAKSNDAAVEAPMMEAIRVGWKSGPMA